MLVRQARAVLDEDPALHEDLARKKKSAVEEKLCISCLDPEATYRTTHKTSGFERQQILTTSAGAG
jgi:hypothetical protein